MDFFCLPQPQYDNYLAHFRSESDRTEDWLAEAWLAWTPKFARRVTFFYSMQKSNLADRLEEEVRRQAGDSYEYLEFEEERELRLKAREKLDYGVIWDNWTQWIDEMNSWEKYQFRQLPKVSVKGFIPSVFQSIEGDQPVPYFFTHMIDEWYFNTVIHNDADKVHELKRLPYPEYLKTNHWSFVRELMLILHRARCQNTECVLADEGFWHGDEWYVHVHHKSYKNRGNERYADLTLLCKRCHEKTHGVTA